MPAVIQIVFTAKEWMEASPEENRNVVASAEAMARSPLFTYVTVQTGVDNSQTINAALASDAELWRLRCEEARAEIVTLKASVDRAVAGIIRWLHDQAGISDEVPEVFRAGDWVPDPGDPEYGDVALEGQGYQ